MESLEPKLREAALVVLRRYGCSEEELELEVNKPGFPAYCEMRAYRIKIHVDDGSANFLVRGGRWSGQRSAYPSTGSFIADFEAQLGRAMTGWR